MFLSFSLHPVAPNVLQGNSIHTCRNKLRNVSFQQHILQTMFRSKILIGQCHVVQKQLYLNDKIQNNFRNNSKTHLQTKRKKETWFVQEELNGLSQKSLQPFLAIQSDHQARLIMLNVDKDKITSLTENDTEPK